MCIFLGVYCMKIWGQWGTLPSDDGTCNKNPMQQNGAPYMYSLGYTRNDCYRGIIMHRLNTTDASTVNRKCGRGVDMKYPPALTIQFELWAKWWPFKNDTYKYMLTKNVFWFKYNVITFLPRGSINDYSLLDQVKAWHRTGDKPLFEPMII